MHLATIDVTTRDLQALEIVPLQIRRFQLVCPSRADSDWLRQTLDRESRPLGTAVMPIPDGRFAVSWACAPVGTSC